MKKKKIGKIIAWVLILLLLIGLFVFLLKFTDGGTGEFKTFYVEHDGKMLAQTDDVRLSRGIEDRFDVKYTFAFASEETHGFDVKVLSAGETFAYTLDGASGSFRPNLDFSKAFAIEKNEKEGYFKLKAPLTMKDAIEKVYGKEAALEEPDLEAVSRFTIVVTSYNEASVIKLHVFLKYPELEVELDHSGIVFGDPAADTEGKVDPPSEEHSIGYTVCIGSIGDLKPEYKSYVTFTCVSRAKAGEEVTFSFTVTDSYRVGEIWVWNSENSYVKTLGTSGFKSNFTMLDEDVTIVFVLSRG